VVAPFQLRDPPVLSANGFALAGLQSWERALATLGGGDVVSSSSPAY